jgi:hypothetical protein
MDSTQGQNIVAAVLARYAELIPTKKRIERGSLIGERLGADGELVCYYCGKPIAHRGAYHPGGLHVDHLYPQYAGGSGRESNLVYACHDCNLAKSSKSPTEWLRLVDIPNDLAPDILARLLLSYMEAYANIWQDLMSMDEVFQRLSERGEPRW